MVDRLDILVAEIFDCVGGSVKRIVVQEDKLVILCDMQIELKDIGVEILAVHARLEREHRVFGHDSAARAMCGNERGISSYIRIDLAAVSHCRRRPRHERGIHADKDDYNS